MLSRIEPGLASRVRGARPPPSESQPELELPEAPEAPESCESGAPESPARDRLVERGRRRLDHPHVVRILDDDTTDDGEPFLVMELLEGETLGARWERSGRRLEAGEVAVLVDRLLEVLVAAHAKGIVHRDVALANVFLTQGGALKILDFGITSVAGRHRPARNAGCVMGNPAFMPPEQARGRTDEIDARSDVWAVGALAFTLLSGRYVHEAETAIEMLALSMSETPRSLAAVAPDVPRPLVDVVDRALMPDRARRWRDASAMREGLAEEYERAFGVPLPHHVDGRTKVPPPLGNVRRATNRSPDTGAKHVRARPRTSPTPGRGRRAYMLG
jgi:serine/threonine-protein kinase